MNLYGIMPCNCPKTKKPPFLGGRGGFFNELTALAVFLLSTEASLQQSTSAVNLLIKNEVTA